LNFKNILLRAYYPGEFMALAIVEGGILPPGKI
jgi:hypothetical protein